MLVVSVENGSPAERAGLRQSDIIVGYDRRPIASVDALHRLLTDDAVGRSAPLIALRGAERLSVGVVPAESRTRPLSSGKD